MTTKFSTLPKLEYAIGLVLISNDGHLRFTSRGRKFLGRRLARHGINLSDIKTVSQYEDTQQYINWQKAADLEDAVEKFRRLDIDPFRFLENLLDGKLTVAEICEICQKAEGRMPKKN